jgi:hypothetical protein
MSKVFKVCKVHKVKSKELSQRKKGEKGSFSELKKSNRPATSNRQPATSNRQPATGNRQPATSNIADWN